MNEKKSKWTNEKYMDEWRYIRITKWNKSLNKWIKE